MLLIGLHSLKFEEIDEMNIRVKVVGELCLIYESFRRERIWHFLVSFVVVVDN